MALYHTSAGNFTPTSVQIPLWEKSGNGEEREVEKGEGPGLERKGRVMCTDT